jgi:hypothetical protein
MHRFIAQENNTPLQDRLCSENDPDRSACGNLYSQKRTNSLRTQNAISLMVIEDSEYSSRLWTTMVKTVRRRGPCSMV